MLEFHTLFLTPCKAQRTSQTIVSSSPIGQCRTPGEPHEWTLPPPTWLDTSLEVGAICERVEEVDRVRRGVDLSIAGSAIALFGPSPKRVVLLSSRRPFEMNSSVEDGT